DGSTEDEGGERLRRSEAVESDEGSDQAEDSDGESDDVLSYSAAEVLRERDFADLTEEELAQARRLMAQLQWRIGRRRSRRKVASPKGRFIDPRRTMRRSLQTSGVPLQLLRRKTKTKPRQLVVICDVSGSMDRYSRILLQFVYAIENNMARVEAFVFGTRLSRVTRLLRRRSIDDAMERVAREVQDWSGGTRIGQSLQSFNQDWARRVLRNGAVVLIISDGWDRGDPELLRKEMARLQRGSYRLIWLNPLLGSPRYEPLTRGMQAAMPYIDDFMPVHNLASLEALAKHLSEIDDARPVRRQQPILPASSVTPAA
ncbi:MAG: VWA domain-containing protein, partial [Thermomicrobiales bacterium]|nr:VWA domain-containing protein [Thermomicrobiales bacterium]